MAFIVFVILIYISAFIYIKLFRKRLTYFSIPDSIISNSRKEGILKTHVFATLIISILVTQQLNSYIKILTNSNTDNYYVILLGAYIFLLITIGYLIDFLLKKFNPQVSFINTIIENPILSQEFEHLKTDKLMDFEEFWNFLNRNDNLVNSKEYKVNLQNLSIELEKYHPIKVVEFEKSLSFLRDELLSEELFEYYLYIWGRKYQDNLYFEFMEFIIAQGKTKYEQVKIDPSNIHDLDFDVYQLNKCTISSIVSNVYSVLVHRIFPFKNNEKEYYITSKTILDINKLKISSPTIYNKFK